MDQSRPGEEALTSTGWGALRISDEDSDLIAAVLDRHAAEGRLTMDELDQRLGVLYDAQTRAQAAQLVADLPPLVVAEKPRHFHLGREHDPAPPPLPPWLATPSGGESMVDTPAADQHDAPAPAPAGTHGKAWAGDLDNEIGHVFQARRRAINAELEQGRAAGQAGEVERLNAQLQQAKDWAAAARQAAAAGDRATAKQLIARIRDLSAVRAEPPRASPGRGSAADA